MPPVTLTSPASTEQMLVFHAGFGAPAHFTVSETLLKAKPVDDVQELDRVWIQQMIIHHWAIVKESFCVPHSKE